MKRILTVDGGGIKGVIPAIICTEIESRTGKKINEIFDFLSGTSTGSILTAMYAAGVPARDVLNIYVQEGKELFEKKVIWKRFFGKNASKYDRSKLKARISQYLSKQEIRTMSDFKVKLALTSFGRIAGRTHYITSWMNRHSYVPAIHAISWSALSAAHYFGKICEPEYKWMNAYQQPEPTWMKGEVFQDGGQGIHNCTAADALRTAIWGFGWKRKDNIYVLSLGCGSQLLKEPDYASVANDGWFSQVKDYIFQARDEAIWNQVHNAKYILDKIYYKISDENHFTRIDPLIEKKHDKLDGIKYIQDYVKYGNAMKGKIPEWISN